MPSTTAKRRAAPFDYIVLKPTKPRVFTLAHDAARWLDLQAGVELAHGHVQAAEMLARRAAELREARQ